MMHGKTKIKELCKLQFVSRISKQKSIYDIELEVKRKTAWYRVHSCIGNGTQEKAVIKRRQSILKESGKFQIYIDGNGRSK